MFYVSNFTGAFHYAGRAVILQRVIGLKWNFPHMILKVFSIA